MGWKSVFSIGRSQTGRKDKPVNSARRQICKKYASAPAGQYDPAQIRWIMLDQVYKVPPKWMQAYGTYTNALAQADLKSCASVGKLPHSNKIVRYDKLGIGSINQAANYALKKYHGFSNKNVANYKQEGGAYSSLAALKNIRRGRRDKYRPETKGTRYSISRFGTVLNKKKPQYMYRLGQHTGPSTPYKYNWRERHAAKPAPVLKPMYTNKFMGQLNNMQAQRLAQQRRVNKPTAPTVAQGVPLNAVRNRQEFKQAMQNYQRTAPQQVTAKKVTATQFSVPAGYKMKTRWQSLPSNEQARRVKQSLNNIAKRKAQIAASRNAAKKNKAPSTASSQAGYGVAASS
jgi:hypothetical protein